MSARAARRVSRPTAELSIDGWRQGIRFAASHIVPHHPKCGHLHGHTYAVSCKLEGSVPEDGMILDFGIVKDEIRRLCEDLDHSWMLPRDPDAGEIILEEERVIYEVGSKTYDVPAADVTFVDIPVCTAEFLANMFADRLMKQVEFPATVERVEIGIDEGHGKGAWVERSP